MGLTEQSIVGCFLEFVFQFYVAQVLVGLRKQFIYNFVFPIGPVRLVLIIIYLCTNLYVLRLAVHVAKTFHFPLFFIKFSYFQMYSSLFHCFILLELEQNLRLHHTFKRFIRLMQ